MAKIFPHINLINTGSLDIIDARQSSFPKPLFWIQKGNFREKLYTDFYLIT